MYRRLIMVKKNILYCKKYKDKCQLESLFECEKKMSITMTLGCIFTWSSSIGLNEYVHKHTCLSVLHRGLNKQGYKCRRKCFVTEAAVYLKWPLKLWSHLQLPLGDDGEASVESSDWLPLPDFSENRRRSHECRWRQSGGDDVMQNRRQLGVHSRVGLNLYFFLKPRRRPCSV